MSRNVRNGRDYFSTASWLIQLNQQHIVHNQHIIGCFNKTRLNHDSMVIFEDSHKDAIESFKLSFRHLFWPKTLERRLMDIKQDDGISGMRIRVQIPAWMIYFGTRVKFNCESELPFGFKDCILPAKLQSQTDQSELTFIRHPELEYEMRLEFDFLAWLWDLTLLTAGKSVSLTVYFLTVITLDRIQTRRQTEGKLILEEDKIWSAFGIPLLVSFVMDGIGFIESNSQSGRFRNEYQIVWYLRVFHRIFAMFISKGIAQLAFLLLTHIWIRHRHWIQETYSTIIHHLKRLNSLKQILKRWTGIMWNLMVYVLMPCWLHPAVICALSLEWNLERALEGDYFSSKMVTLHLSGILIQLPSFYSWIRLPIQYKHLSFIDLATSWSSLINQLSFQISLPFESPCKIWIMVYQSMRCLAAGWILIGGSDSCVGLYLILCIWSLMMSNGIIHQRQVEKSQ